SEDDRRSRSRSKSEKSKSKSNSSSVLSSEDLSPLRPPIAVEDVGFSSIQLRPINVPFRRNSSSVTPEEHQKSNGISAIPNTQFTKKISNESFRSTYSGFSRRVPSPETVTCEPISYQRTKMFVDTVEDTSDSPRSAISSICKEPEGKLCTVLDKELDEQEEEDEVMSSYVIEISTTSDKMEETNGIVDEAIAWAREKFLAHSLEELDGEDDQRNRDDYAEKEESRIKLDQRIMDPAERMQFLTAFEGPKKWTVGEGKQQSKKDVRFL
ncbi:uncharacterized protein LOC122093901, partial [Macadamia integrifolia]|uniref:uncharacterized protein LOC122093901 n=1 Tax=Macadamia integrifolia TaxID=60698 RepID=UPI001C530E57